jgi:hypothetical protein
VVPGMVDMSAIATSPRHRIEQHPDGARTRFSYFDPTPDAMSALVDLLFVKNWRHLTVGPCIEGAVFEVRFERPPEIRTMDGYLTVDLGYWHFHLCIGPHKGTPSDELRRLRPVATAALFERRGAGCGGGGSWGVRLWNGYGEQMTTVFLPSPALTDDMKMAKTPDWSRLALYYELREKLLGERGPADFEAAGTQEWPAPAAAS